MSRSSKCLWTYLSTLTKPHHNFTIQFNDHSKSLIHKLQIKVALSDGKLLIVLYWCCKGRANRLWLRKCSKDLVSILTIRFSESLIKTQWPSKLSLIQLNQKSLNQPLAATWPTSKFPAQCLATRENSDETTESSQIRAKRC